MNKCIATHDNTNANSVIIEHTTNEIYSKYYVSLKAYYMEAHVCWVGGVK